MKRLLLLGLLSSIWITMHAQSSVDLLVSKAEIYEDGVTVTRSGQLNLTRGEQKVIIGGLSDDLEEQTISVFLGGEAILLSQQLRTRYIDVDTEVSEQEMLKTELQDSLNLLAELLEVMNGEARILESNVAFLATGDAFSAEDVSRLRANYQTEKQDIVRRKAAMNKQIRAVRKSLDLVNKELRVINSKSIDGEGQLVLTIESPRAYTAEIEVDYYMEDAGWSPSYDLRMNGENGPLLLNYKADIWQDTGEDWKDVTISLSTATPSYDNTLPELETYYLSFNNGYGLEGRVTGVDVTQYMDPINGAIGGIVRDASGAPLIGANVTIQGTTVGTITDINGAFAFSKVPKGARVVEVSYVGFESMEVGISKRMNVVLQEGPLLDEVVVTGLGVDRLKGMTAGVAVEIDYSATSISYDLDKPMSIVSSMEEQSVSIRRESLEADVSYIALPKLNQNAYLVAKIKDWGNLQILPGTASIYLDNRYVGHTFLKDNSSNRSENIISLGQDRDVYVDRTLITDYSKTQWIGKNKVEQRKWKLEIVSNKDRPIQLLVKDQYPVSKNDDISVKLTEDGDAQRDKDTGTLKWTINLTPGQRVAKTFAYDVKFPRDRRVVVE